MKENLLNSIELNRLPKHVGIILDGNGRWAKKRFMPRVAGHREGMKRVVDIVQVASDLGIESLSLYAFSTENWKRPEEEVNSLMDILVFYVELQLEKLYINNVKINVLGEVSALPTKARKAIEKAIERTATNTGMILNLGINYGGRAEIIHGISNLISDIKNGDIMDITEEEFKNYLYTANQPELDLLIRPGGELRISNFMLYQLAYAELYFTECLWPDFNEDRFYESIIEFQRRNRRYGEVK